MSLQSVIERYLLDARTWEEKNSRSLARGKELLAAGKTGQAMRMFAYNHSLNQNKPAPDGPAYPKIPVVGHFFYLQSLANS